MHFVGLDLAWGEKNNTGIAVVDSDGRLLHVGAAHDDENIETAVAPYVSDDCLVAIDAPLIVGTQPAPGRARRRSTATSTRSRRAPIRRTPRTSRSRVLAARGSRDAFTLDMNPASTSTRRAIEVYPHPATIALFGLEKTPQVQEGNFREAVSMSCCS